MDLGPKAYNIWQLKDELLIQIVPPKKFYFLKNTLLILMFIRIYGSPLLS